METGTTNSKIKKENLMKEVNEEVKGDKFDLNVKQVSIEMLSVPLHHPRKHPEDNKSLQESIRRDGLQEPILVYEGPDGKYLVIDGVRRLVIASEFGWKEVHCIIKTGMADQDAAHLSYVKNMERNNLNPIDIAIHLKTMKEKFGYTLAELELKGYGSRASISNKLKLLDLTEPVQKSVVSGELSEAHGLELIKLPTAGEQERKAKQILEADISAKRTKAQIDRYLKKGKAKAEKTKNPFPEQNIPGVYIKDSQDMSELPDKSVHLIVTSPPYNVGMEYEKGVTYEEHLEMVKNVLNECARVLMPGGVIALNVGDIFSFNDENRKDTVTTLKLMGSIYQGILKSHDILLKDMIVWTKAPCWSKPYFQAYSEDLVHTAYRIITNFEPVYIYRKRGERELPSEEIVLKSILTKEEYVSWTPGVWNIHPQKTFEGHPTVWPDELPKRLIKMFSYVGDTVLDPWLGSGTTVKVAKELDREGIGYEKEPQYKSVIMKRLGIETMVDYAKHSLEEVSAAEEQDTPKTMVMMSPGFKEEVDKIMEKTAEEPMAA